MAAFDEDSSSNEHSFNTECDHEPEKATDCMLSETDENFDWLLKDKIKRITKNDVTSRKTNSDMRMLSKDLKMANEKTPQHNVNELVNQRFYLERLNLMLKEKKLKKSC